MTGRLHRKVALITGGARGQGAAEARRFVLEGATVVITDVLDDIGRETAAEIGTGCRFLHHDVTSRDDWAHVVNDVVNAHDRIDVLVNNAGIFKPGRLLDGDDEVYHQIMRINTDGVYYGMRAVAPTMVKQASGSIINISSIAGMRGSNGFIAYSTSKWAVRGMTKSAAQELARHNVRVNSVHPGIIDTPMLEAFDALGVRGAVRERIPMQREASADEVAQIVLFLASDESSYSTGSEFVVDGGYSG